MSEISRGEGGGKQREGHNFLRLRKGRGHEKWAVKRGRVMQIYALDHVEVHPRKKKEVLYLVEKKKKKKKKKEQWNIMDTNYEVLLQEFNKHLLFIYNNAIESYCILIMNNVVINVIRVLAILLITVFSITIDASVSSALIQSLSSSL